MTMDHDEMVIQTNALQYGHTGFLFNMKSYISLDLVSE